MAGTVLHGLGASPGVAVGRAVVIRDVVASTAPPDRSVALAALDQAAAELGRAAESLRNSGLADEAEILEANRLMAEDPSLAASVSELAVRLAPGEALREATEAFASVLAALPDPVLAGRASDVRELGRRAARIADGSATQLLVEAENARRSPLAYEIAPQELLRVHDLLDEEDLEVGAIYHSHTRTEPVPSQTDINLAFYPEALYIIVGLAGQDPDVRAFRIVDGRVSQADLEVVG